MKTPLHVLGEHNGTKTELYRTNAKNQDLVPAHFALTIASEASFLVCLMAQIFYIIVSGRMSCHKIMF